MLRYLCACLMLGSVVSQVSADTTIVDENFDGYADQSAFEAVWQPDSGSGNAPLGTPTGILVPDTDAGLTPPNDDPTGIQGKAVNAFGNINEYIGPATTQMATLYPTATQNVRLTADIFEDGTGNKNTTVGLRNKTTPSNLIELGFLNYAVDDDPNTDFAFRTALFGSGNVNWVYFPLDEALDSDDTDTKVSVSDIGEGWHRFTAEIGLTEATFTLDFYRDGLTNSETTEGVGEAGVDSSVTIPLVPFNPTNATPDSFNSLRFGRASGGTGSKETVVDNILLELIDIATPTVNADFNSDGIVDGEDFLTWQQNSGLMSAATLMDGDANQDQIVDGADLAIWQDQYGPVAATAAAAVVPEPTSAALALLALAGLLGRMRKVKC